MDFDTIFITGPQGSGKGTQGRMLAQKLGFLFWEMGGILRGMRKEANPLSKKVTDLIDRGIYLPDDMLIEVIGEKLAVIPSSRGVIFDGIPRRVGQADFMLNFLKEQNRKPPITIHLDLQREDSFKRLLLRAEKEKRKDDTKEGIEMRLRQHEEEVKPTIEYLKKKTRFIDIDGSKSVAEVAVAIDKALGLK